MRTRSRALCATLAAGSLLGGGIVVAGAGGAEQHDRAPKAGERTAIARTAIGTIPTAERRKFRVGTIRISTRSRFWASAVVTPRPAFRTTTEGVYMILVRSAVSNRWTILDIGTSGVGCRVAPISVLRDLGYAGECPPGERL